MKHTTTAVTAEKSREKNLGSCIFNHCGRGMWELEEEKEESPKDMSGKAGLFTLVFWKATRVLLPF